MAEKINVQCYRCKTVYNLEYELRGQLVECAVCNTIFVVPKLGEDHNDKILKTNPYIEESSSKHSDSKLHTSPKFNTANTSTKTKTIKLSRTSCGMVPDVDDKLGACEARNPLQHKKNTKAKKDTLDDFAKTQVKSAKDSPEAPSKWWHFGKKKK